MEYSNQKNWVNQEYWNLRRCFSIKSEYSDNWIWYGPSFKYTFLIPSCLLTRYFHIWVCNSKYLSWLLISNASTTYFLNGLGWFFDSSLEDLEWGTSIFRLTWFTRRLLSKIYQYFFSWKKNQVSWVLSYFTS